MQNSTFNLRELLTFDPGQGLIKLAETRMMLFNQSAMSSLRKIMVQQVGESVSRMIFAKFGYESAVRDFKSIQGLFPNLEPNSYLSLGPLMHSWSGLVQVVPEIMEMNHETGHFYFKGRWINSYEAHAHLENFGVSKNPVCYSLTGYGSGWCSEFFGRRLLEIETKCVACGDDFCEWEIRPWDEWDQTALPWKQSMMETSRSIHAELEQSLGRLKDINEQLEQVIEKRTIENKIQLRTLCHDLDAPLQLAIAELEPLQISNHRPNHRALKSLKNIEKMVVRARESQSLSDGKKLLKYETFYVQDLIDDALDLIKHKLQLKDMNLKLNIPKNLSAYSDQDILRDHVLTNILTNAIKFSAPGSTISIDAVECLDMKVCLRISDQGIGIPDDALAKIFESRTCSSHQGTEGEQGTGYGMPLMRQYLKSLGGDVSILTKPIHTNVLDHGTTVSCIF